MKKGRISSSISDTDKIVVKKLLEQYESRFDALVTENGNIASLTATMRKAVHEITFPFLPLNINSVVKLFDIICILISF